MKIFANKKIKCLFVNILSCIIGFTLISILLANFEIKNATYYIIICSLCMGIIILLLCYGYFREQHRIMENAISQITEYISGNKDVTIECNDEGELYRLFHEVNSLVAILNAHAENEKSAKKFLRNTISDISHQLKTPLAALTVLNLKERRNHLPSQLSGGQQQRVAIGRALITRPSLILADEPTGNLDTQNSSEVISLLKEASRKYEQTIIMITHNRSIAQSADRILQVSDGVLTDLGRCRE